MDLKKQTTKFTVKKLAKELASLIAAGEGERLVVVGVGEYVRSSASNVLVDGEHQIIIK